MRLESLVSNASQLEEVQLAILARRCLSLLRDRLERPSTSPVPTVTRRRLAVQARKVEGAARQVEHALRAHTPPARGDLAEPAFRRGTRFTAAGDESVLQEVG